MTTSAINRYKISQIVYCPHFCLFPNNLLHYNYLPSNYSMPFGVTENCKVLPTHALSDEVIQNAHGS